MPTQPYANTTRKMQTPVLGIMATPMTGTPLTMPSRSTSLSPKSIKTCKRKTPKKGRDIGNDIL